MAAAAVSAAPAPIGWGLDPQSSSTADGPASALVDPRGRGGPDSAGYRWIDSDEPDGPTFQWTDISVLGTQIPEFEEGWDDGYYRIGLPWSFPFYGELFGGLHICTNGWVSLDTVRFRVRFSNGPIPEDRFPNTALYVWWDDLDLTNAGAVHYYHDTTHVRFIVQYTGVRSSNGGPTDDYTFQLILKPNGEIMYQYLAMNGDRLGASIGIENQSGTVGLEVVRDRAYVRDSLAIRFTRDSSSTARIRLEPAELTFGNLLLGTADSLTIRVQNITDTTLQVNSLLLSGEGFSLVGPPAVPFTLAPGGSVDLEVGFAPATPGTRTGSLTIASNDPLHPEVSADLSGAGIVAIVPALPGVLYAAASGIDGGVLHTIDRSNGTMGVVGSLGIPELHSLTVRRSTGELYGIATDTLTSLLYRISADSGAAVRAADIPLGDVRAIAFNAGDTLYAATGSGRLYRLNPVTGDTLFVGATSGLHYSGLSFSPTTGLLWAVVRPPLDTVYIVDPSTGTAGVAGATGLFALNSAITHDPSGVPYAIIDAGAGENYLAALDVTTAAGTLVSPGPLAVTNIMGIAMRQDSVVTDVGGEGSGSVPTSFALEQNYPNPFNPVTTITFAIPHQGDRVGTRLGVSVIVYDLLGRPVATIVDDNRAPGMYSVQFNASHLASGTYIYRLTAGGFTAVRRMMLVR